MFYQALDRLCFLFSCPGCGFPPTYSSFPLCSNCFNSLIVAPNLCPTCASPFCGPTCLRPWLVLNSESGIGSFHAAYLLLAQGYTVLKAWKKKRGILFNKRIFRKESISSILEKYDYVVPIPHTISRVRELDGSPSEALALWLSKAVRKPLLQVIKKHPSSAQAKLSINDRLSNRLSFSTNSLALKVRSKSVILVDDFYTTGHTVRTAATCLKQAGVNEIAAFCLGVRVNATR